jgi:hypothetical protein
MTGISQTTPLRTKSRMTVADDAAAMDMSVSSRRTQSGYTILNRKSIPKWKMMKISTVANTAAFSLFSKILCNIDGLLAWKRRVVSIDLCAVPACFMPAARKRVHQVNQEVSPAGPGQTRRPQPVSS